VDDIVLATPSNSFDLLLQSFNTQHSRLQFTMEIERDKKISFLDLIFINDNGRLIFDLYRKPTFLGRFLNFHSHHIKMQSHRINRQSDTEILSDAYAPIIQHLKIDYH